GVRTYAAMTVTTVMHQLLPTLLSTYAVPPVLKVARFRPRPLHRMCRGRAAGVGSAGGARSPPDSPIVASTQRHSAPGVAAQPLQGVLSVRTMTPSLAGNGIEPPTTGRPAACIPLTEALAREAAAWERLRERSIAASPFAGLAWHRAWAKSASVEDLRESCCV